MLLQSILKVVQPPQLTAKFITSIRSETFPLGRVIYLNNPVETIKERIHSIVINNKEISGSEIEELRGGGSDVVFKQQIGVLGIQQTNIGDKVTIYFN